VRFSHLLRRTSFPSSAIQPSRQAIMSSEAGAFVITSPIAQALYKAGADVPISYQYSVGSATGVSSLALFLTPATGLTFNYTIANPADIFPDPKVFHPQGLPGEGYYQFLWNYTLPRNLTAGAYDISFNIVTFNIMTNAYDVMTIPIQVSGLAPPPVSTATPTTTASSTSVATATAATATGAAPAATGSSSGSAQAPTNTQANSTHTSSAITKSNIAKWGVMAGLASLAYLALMM